MPCSSDNQLMPFSKIPRGNLYLRFDVQFPTDLTHETISKLVQCLRRNEEDCN